MDRSYSKPIENSKYQETKLHILSIPKFHGIIIIVIMMDYNLKALYQKLNGIHESYRNSNSDNKTMHPDNKRNNSQ